MKKVTKFTILIVVLLLLALCLANLIIANINKMGTLKDNTISALGSCSTVRVIKELAEGPDLWRPIPEKSGQIIYCIEPGAHVPITGNSYEDLQKWVRDEHFKETCGCAQDPPDEGARSDTYYYCENRHYTESSRYNGEANLYDVGYILSYNYDPRQFPSEVKWAGGVQQAVWMSPICETGDPGRGTYRAEGDAIRKQSLSYKSFYEKIMEPDADGRTGAKPVDLTDHKKVKLDTDQETKLHKLGPFKLNYIDGQDIELGISFGGISDMYLIGNNGQRIDIKAFIRTQHRDNKEINAANDRIWSNYSEPSFFTNIEPIDGFENPNKVDWWAYLNYYPKPQEEFYVEFEYVGEDVSSFTLHVDFKWLICKANICLRDGVQWELVLSHNDYNEHQHWESDGDGGGEWVDCHDCEKQLVFEKHTEPQNGVFVIDSSRTFGEDSIDIPVGDGLTNNMKIGGYVYEDALQGKETIANGILDANDTFMPNIQVSLYDAETNQLAKLAPAADELVKQKDETDAQFAARKRAVTDDKNDYTRRINPTLTDDNGYYEFRGVSTEKKYYLKFTYNGQTYMATDYLASVTDGNGRTDYRYDSVKEMVQANEYDGPTNEGVNLNTQKWKETSKGTEKPSEREDLDEMFEHIGSSPENYPTTNSLRKVGSYNKTFSNKDLMGYTLSAYGEYRQTGTQLIDGYLYNSDGSVSDRYSQGLITQKIKEYIDDNRKYPDENDMKNVIYQSIARNNQETWRKLQFIEDCKISSYTKGSTVERERSFDQYPVYEQFTTYVESGNKYPNNSYDRGTFADNSTYANHLLKHNNAAGTFGEMVLETVNGIYSGYHHTDLYNDQGEIIYKNVYKGQIEINQGLITRPPFDAALKKDVYKATLKINGRTEIYAYNERDLRTEEEKQHLKALEAQYGKDSNQYLAYEQQLEDKYWEIQSRIVGNNYDTYYGEKYERQLYPSERNYTGTNPLEAYITYKITIRNQSQNILAQIDEIVDYYDSTYTFEPNLSWVMYEEGSRDDIRVTDQDYYDIMSKGSKDATGKAKYRNVTTRNFNTTTGQYGANTRFNLGNNYKTLYVNGVVNHKLQPGESEYLYLTFRVNGSGNSLVIENNNTSPGKQNIAEINGYTTYYQDGTRLPNDVIKDSRDIAGLIDRDSNPGNFDRDALNNTAGSRRYEQNFEDDADRARGINVYVEDNLIRQVSGTVWEDKRTYKPDNTDALVGNGVKEDEEKRVNGVLVELHEIVNGVTSEKVARVYNTQTGKWYDAAMLTTQNPETKEDGYYSFEGFIPGDYVIRFIYGGDTVYNYYQYNNSNDATGQTYQSYQCNSQYNGQDYKSTSYQYDHINGIQVPQSEKNNGRTDISGDEWTGYAGYDVNNTKHHITSGHIETNDQQANKNRLGYNIYTNDTYTDASGRKINVSDARDIWQNSAEETANNLKLPNRTEVNNASSIEVTNNQAQSLENERNRQNKYVRYANTIMRAETGAIRMEFEYNRQATAGNNSYNNDGYRGTGSRNPINYKDTTNQGYHIENVDLGLEERPKAGLELNKQISNIKITLANQTILFDTTQTVKDLIWRPKLAYNINEMKQETAYDTEGPRVDKKLAQNAYSDYTRYDDFRNAVLDRINSLVTREKGLIQVTMDEELMHGTTIQITYDMSVTNIGEVDYKEESFYYIGIVKDKNTIVKTSADLVMDYVANNLQFRSASNDTSWGWKTITNQEIKDKKYVNTDVEKELKDYNTIITTQELGKKLIPVTQSTLNSDQTHDDVKLILTQLITSQNKDDDLSYGNIAEIVKISNDVGRRMAYSVQGNQSPSGSPTEPDASRAEQVIILPPFGEQYLYLGLAIIIALSIAISTVVIKKTVFKHKDM